MNQCPPCPRYICIAPEKEATSRGLPILGTWAITGHKGSICKKMGVTSFNHTIFSSILIFLLLNFTTASGQILNIDSELSDSMIKRRYVLLSGTFSHDKQKKNLNDLTTGIEFVEKLKNSYALVLVGQANLVLSAKEIIQNEGYLQCKYRDLDMRKTSIEAYSQFQWNGLWGLEQRALAGANVRKKITDKRNGDCYLGLGSFYEMEVWNFNGVEDPSKVPAINNPIQTRRIRANTYIKGAKKIFKNCDIVGESMLQANINSLFDDPSFRWFLLGKINYQVSDKFLLTFNYDHILNQKPTVPINRIFVGYSLDINIKL